MNNKNKPSSSNSGHRQVAPDKSGPIPYPVRINRYLALKGVAARRRADELVDKGLVLINGRRASVGDVVEKNDVVKVSSTMKEQYFYVLYNKPRGQVTHSALPGEKEVSIAIKGKKLSPIGRLDKESEGLLLLSNDGRIVDRLLNPKYDHEKEYVVDVDVPLKPSFKKRIESGVLIEGYLTKKARVKILGETRFSIIITEGKKHQIRRMCAALGYQIKNLRRVRIGNIKLGSVKPGSHRELSPKEVVELIKDVGL